MENWQAFRDLFERLPAGFATPKATFMEKIGEPLEGCMKQLTVIC